MMNSNLSYKKYFDGFLLAGILLLLGWFYSVTPRPQATQIIQPNLETTEQAPETFVQRDWVPQNGGLFWIRFITEPQLFSVNKYRLRTLSCLNSLTINNQEWNLPPSSEVRCSSIDGITLNRASFLFKQRSEWSFAGSTEGGSYGLILDKDWSDPLLIGGISLLALLLGGLLYRRLPVTGPLKILFVLLFVSAFLLRFWAVFIQSPPELNIYSDMEAYHWRGVEILNHNYNVAQIFQPIGYTLWSLGLRLLGGWELFKWTQVFLSFGTVLVIFLMTLESLGLATAVIATLLTSVHVPFIAYSSLHMAECTYTFLLALSVWMSVKAVRSENLWRYFTLGLVMMCAFYFKATHSFFIPLFCLWLLYRDRKKISTGIAKILVMGAACLVVATPHLIFTGKYFDKPYLGPTAGGMNFVMGKCPWKNLVDNTGASWLSPLFYELGQTATKKYPVNFADQSYFYKEGLQCVRDNPAILLESFSYIYYLIWGPHLWPVENTSLKSWFQPWAQVFRFALLPLCLIGLIARMRTQNDYDKVAVLYLLSLLLMVYIYYSENRFRVPFDFIVIIWAAYGLVRIWQTVSLGILSAITALQWSGELSEKAEG